MHDHNLDDLIIENVEPKHRKTKSLLTLIALMIVVLIVAIIFTKTLLKTPDNSDLAFEQDATELIAPELKLKEPAKVPEPKREASLSTVAENEVKAPIEQTTETESHTTKTESAPNVAQAPVSKIQTEKDAADIAYWESVQAQRRAAKAAEAEKAKKAVKKTVEVAERTQSKKVPTVVRKNPIAARTVSKTASNQRYYIQVGAFKTQPNQRFLSIIKNNGLNYHITKPNAYNMKQLLIGPYTDEASAKLALVRVRDRIMKRAFIVRKR